ncbi:MAG: ParB/RepB/Spo0J family partition protein, partial [Desulfovibrionaceae bacterium]|nr:ParB/RepB/Spo0J family partition protein [Desulfovibrionaceae bacterium]
MSNANKGLGRGLDVLFGGAETRSLRQENSSQLAVNLLQPNPNQPRRHFDAEALEELAASIRAQGIVQPLLVRPMGENTWQIVAGERR